MIDVINELARFFEVSEPAIQGAGTVVVILTALFGLLYCFAGYRSVKAITTAVGFFIGLLGGYILTGEFQFSSPLPVIMPLLVGVVFAVLNFFLFRLSVFVAVFFVTSSVVSSLLLNYVQLDELIGFVIALAAGLIFAILAVIFLKPVIIVTTGLMGGLLFADQIFSYLIQVRWNAQTETLVRLGTGLILGVIGIICQFVSTRKD